MNTFVDLAEIVMRVRREDGSWSARPIWVVAVDGDAYVRSAFGHRGAWYREVRAGAAAEIEAAGMILPVRLEPVSDPALVQRVSDGYRAKYALSWPGPAETMAAGEACATTMRVLVVSRAIGEGRPGTSHAIGEDLPGRPADRPPGEERSLSGSRAGS
ncbi:DUF2255 family protein [Streptosporangium sp. NPDC000396]|uniref:DUF2255 family protein n=1 Tax=Streptosporangium sp. NPDC000396 TaxID=3366185 RepID=UPI0036938E7E